MASNDRREVDGNVTAASVCKVLGHMSFVKRAEILAALARRPMTVSEIADLLRYDVPDVSKNLKALRQSGLLTVEQAKSFRIHRISSSVSVKLRVPYLRILIRLRHKERVSCHYCLHGSTVELIDGQNGTHKHLGGARQRLPRE